MARYVESTVTYLARDVSDTDFNNAADQSGTLQSDIDALSDGDVLTFKDGVIKLTTSTTISKKIMLLGVGDSTQFRSGSNIQFFIVSTAAANGFRAKHFRMTGPGEGGSNTNSYGLFMSQCREWVVENVKAEDFDSAGFYAQNSNLSNYEGGTYLNCIAEDCDIGFQTAATGEYIDYLGCKAISCAIGFQMAGGNNTFNGGGARACVEGFKHVTGVNSGKSSATGMTFNHCTTYSVNIDDCANGFIFMACHFWGGTIRVNAHRITFDGCTMQPTRFDFPTNTTPWHVDMDKCSIHNTPANTTGDKTNVVWNRCLDNNFDPYIG